MPFSMSEAPKNPAQIRNENAWRGQGAGRPSSTSTRPTSSARRRVGWPKLDAVPVDDELACVLEGHRDAVADHRLDLPQAPVRPFRMAHEIARGEQGIAGFLEQDFVTLGYGSDSWRVRPV